MRARWAMLALALCGCPDKKPPPPTAPSRPEPTIHGAPVGVQLPNNWEGYLAISPDDSALAVGEQAAGNNLEAGSGVIDICDALGRVTSKFVLPGQDREARSFLAREQFQGLTRHPPERYVNETPELSNELGNVRVKFGNDVFNWPAFIGVPSIAGWSPDERVLVIRIERPTSDAGSIRDVHYVLIKVAK